MKPAISGLNKYSLFPFWVLFQKSDHHTCDFRALEKGFPTPHMLSFYTESAHSCLKCLNKHIASWFWPNRPLGPGGWAAYNLSGFWQENRERACALSDSDDEMGRRRSSEWEGECRDWGMEGLEELEQRDNASYGIWNGEPASCSRAAVLGIFSFSALPVAPIEKHFLNVSVWKNH